MSSSSMLAYLITGPLPCIYYFPTDFFSRFSAYREISKNCSTSLFPAENEDFYGQVCVVAVIFLS